MTCSEMPTSLDRLRGLAKIHLLEYGNMLTLKLKFQSLLWLDPSFKDILGHDVIAEQSCYK